MNGQQKLEMPKDFRDERVVIKLNHVDKLALEAGMAKVGEVNKSAFIRRLIHEFSKKK